MTTKLNISTTKNKNKINERRVEEKGKGIDKGAGFGAKNGNINEDRDNYPDSDGKVLNPADPDP